MCTQACHTRQRWKERREEVKAYNRAYYKAKKSVNNPRSIINRRPIVEGAITRIPLRNPRGSKEYFSIIDTADLPLVEKHVFWLDHVNYAITSDNLKLHTLILGKEENKVVDHINGDQLDNRRANLRFATMRENALNRKVRRDSISGYKGVSLSRQGNWIAKIKPSGKIIYLGTYKTKEEAARAYDAGALQHYGEFARLNFPEA